MELSTRHGARDYRPLGPSVIEEIARFVRKIFRLYMHVEPATGEQYCNAAQASKSSQAVH
jgi:hypothetical protein